MKSFNAGVPFSKWILRIALVLYLIVFYHDTLIYFDFKDVSFIFALIYVVGAICLLVGGFQNTNNITVFASLILLLAVVFNMYLDFADGIYGLVRHVLPFAIAFFFLSSGNK